MKWRGEMKKCHRGTEGQENKEKEATEDKGNEESREKNKGERKYLLILHGFYDSEQRRMTVRRKWGRAEEGFEGGGGWRAK